VSRNLFRQQYGQKTNISKNNYEFRTGPNTNLKNETYYICRIHWPIDALEVYKIISYLKQEKKISMSATANKIALHILNYVLYT
jgi:hypothetical protein